MTFLDCSVTGCVYNADLCCCKGNIKVDFDHTKTNRGTCCDSFRERTAENMKNAAKRISKICEVACDATDCVFNDEEQCAADHIGIAGGDAHENSQTECASYRCIGERK